MSNWYVARTATRQEYQAVASLRDAGLAAWCPSETRPVRHARQEKPKSYPLFPGYVFVRMLPAEAWKAADAEGVHKLIGGPTESAVKGEFNKGEVVPASDLAWLSVAEHLGMFNKCPWAPDPRFKPGQEVRVSEGKLTGAIGQIVELRGESRITIAIAWFGRSKRVTIPIAQLEAA